MSSPFKLNAERIQPLQAEYKSLLDWPFPASPFYGPQTLDILRNDIPTRITYGTCFVWLFRNEDNEAVGFGTLDICCEYPDFTHGKSHLYIPVLGVHPHNSGRGYGRQIVEYLVRIATLIYQSKANLFDLLFLDVYQANEAAIGLYSNKCQFIALNPNNPIPDPNQNNEPYIVMARKLV